MATITEIQAGDVIIGQSIDLEPIIRQIDAAGLGAGISPVARVVCQDELVEVQGTEIEDGMIAIYNDMQDVVVPVDMKITVKH